MRLVGLFRIWGDRFGILPIIILASISRLWNLGSPATLVFDETYYVKDSYTLWLNGHERAWPKDADLAFNAGDLSGFLNAPEFVVHGPLGKWLLGFGMQMLGADNPWGWRIVPAVFGILSVWLVFLISLRLLPSRRWALVAPFLLALDGQAIVVSRTAVLDGLVSAFALLGFYLLLRALASEKPTRWLLLIGLTLGAGASIKWATLPYLIFFVGYFLLAKGFSWKALLSRWQALLAIPLAAITYLITWSGWFISRGWGYGEKDVIGSFIAYQKQIYNFHANLSTPHGYEANPFTWLFMIRPTSFYFEEQAGLVSAISPIGNPIIWLAACVSVALLFSWFAENRDRVSVLVLGGIMAGYLPWLIFSQRTAFQFYSSVFEPWLMLAIALVAFRYRKVRTTVFASIGVFAIYLFFYPIYSGVPIPLWFWQWHMWLPSWV